MFKLIIYFFSLSAFASDRFIDLTAEKWRGNGDPPVSLTEMESGLSCSLCRLQDKRTSFSWKYDSKGSCSTYTVNFRVEDREGKVLAEESKIFSSKTSSRDSYDKDGSNVIHDGRDHGARLSKNLSDRTFLTIKYWVSDAKCGPAKFPSN